MKKQTSAATITRLVGAVFLLSSLLLFIRVIPVMAQHAITKRYTNPSTPAAAQSLIARKASALGGARGKPASLPK